MIIRVSGFLRFLPGPPRGREYGATTARNQSLGSCSPTGRRKPEKAGNPDDHQTAAATNPADAVDDRGNQ